MGKQMTEMLKGTLEGIVLALLAVGPAYGYEITARLRERGFVLLDTQFTTEHLKRFGAVDVPRGRYEMMLAEAISGEPVTFA